MKIETNRKYTNIELGENYCFNYDSIIEMCIYLAAKEYWNYGGGKEQAILYRNKTRPYYTLSCDRDYRRLEAALNILGEMTEEKLEGWKYDWNSPQRRHKYYKAIDTLYSLKDYMWN